MHSITKEGENCNFSQELKELVEQGGISVASRVEGLPCNEHIRHLAPASPASSAAGGHGGTRGNLTGTDIYASDLFSQ